MVRITKELLLERGLPRSSELSEIKKVNLSKLQLEIKDLDSVLFSQMEKLEELDLSHNRLTVVQKDLGLQNLRVLNLSWNQLEDVSTLKQFQQLTELNYENNLYLTICDNYKMMFLLPNLRLLNGKDVTSTANHVRFVNSRELASRVKNIAKELMTLMLESPKKSTSDPQEKEEQSHSEDEGGDITTGDECEDKGQSLSNPNKRRREGAEFSPSKKARPQITPVTVTLRKSHRAQVSPGKYKKLNNGQPYSTIKSGQSVKNANPACTHQGIKRNTGSPVKNDPKTCGKDIPVRGQAQRMETPMRGQAQQRETPVRGQVQQRETPVRGQVQQRETPVKDQAQHRKLKVEKEENTMMRTLTRKSKPKEPVVLEPLHFLQCHSQENNPEDWITQLWDCVFEPQLDSEHSRGSSGSVATCGGDSVCIIDCETGRVLKKYKVVGEEFFTLAWTTLTVITQEGQKKKMNVLAAAGRRGIVKLIHSKANYCYGEIKAHKKSISALCFSPKQDTFLFTGSYDKKIILWDIGVPETEYNFKVSQLLVLETDSTPLRMNLVPSCLDQYLLAACDDGCFAWDISLKKQEGRRFHELEFEFPIYRKEDDEKDFHTVDGLAFLSNDIVASKSCMQGSIYLWSWTQTLKGRQDKRSKKVKVVILAELQWSDTDLPYITLCTCPEDYLLCGDEKGRVWMYELSSFLQKRMVSEIIPPTQMLQWPVLRVKGKREVEGTVINILAVDQHFAYVVALTDKNIVAIWKRVQLPQKEDC
ncbi:leucine-rich repeat and WD repeat-containing protein 1 isoform X2 [Latimeria chalumnae]|uniref:leucine-rich repeat and WD repeat-containing protein 1 isoform X2 n=1 Tax=Latimeria chalumnae TaxID=7897 RepID=UPI00313AA7B0